MASKNHGRNAPAHSGAKRRKVALALQGGGSHGAFTWGVLDRLLADPTIEIIAVTGTSAGAMNAVVLADGLVRGGPDLARAKLANFWESVGSMVGFGTFLAPLAGEDAAHLPLENTPVYALWDAFAHLLSPHDLNPGDWHPLRSLLAESIDFEALRARDDFPVMICATNARTARRRIFTNADLSVEAMLASACLPTVFPAIKIDGEPYWDGGFSGNPAVLKLVPRLPDCDLLVVRIDPVVREQAPRTVAEIHDRTVEVGFNSAFWLEMSVLGIIKTFRDLGMLKYERFDRIRFHMLEACETMAKFPRSSKSNNHLGLLRYLRTIGSRIADDWLAKNGDMLGRQSSYDMRTLLPMGTEELLGQFREPAADGGSIAPPSRGPKPPPRKAAMRTRADAPPPH